MTVIQFPNVSDDQHVVLLCEVKTGKVLNRKYERHIGEESCYVVFDSKIEAEKFGSKVISSRPDVEVTIMDKAGSVIKVMKNQEYVGNLISLKSKENSGGVISRILSFFKKFGIKFNEQEL